MTDEQKAEELFCKACVHKLFCCSDKRHSRCDKFRFYVKGLSEGRNEAEETIHELKKNVDQFQKDNEMFIKHGMIFNKHNMLCFTAETVWKLANPDTRMCCPNAVFIQVEKMLDAWLKNKEQL